MTSKKEAVKVINSFVTNTLPHEDWYINVKPHIKAVLLYGSVAKGTNREDSDIDVLIIMPLEIEERFTAGEYFYEYQGRQINIVIRSIERLRKIATEAKDKFQQEVFRSCEIIESGPEVPKLLDQLASI